ncbi:unnamed protein product, partial [Soboliphyme baturini]|uniref:PH domain-containing protein n=1 Tax=Soboliphyme baturini TaxID=241478 RepID=A0A183IR25_9BILA
FHVGGSGNSSGGESSCDDRGGRHRGLHRSASDPDCTTSSSEQSCDTVIFLGSSDFSQPPLSKPESLCCRKPSGAPSCFPPAAQKRETQRDFPSHSFRTVDTPIYLSSMAAVGSDINIRRDEPVSGHSSSLNMNGPYHLGRSPEESRRTGSGRPFQRTEPETWVDGPKAQLPAVPDLPPPALANNYKIERVKMWISQQEMEQRSSGLFILHKQANGVVPPKGLKPPMGTEAVPIPIYSSNSETTGEQCNMTIQTASDASMLTVASDVDCVCGPAPFPTQLSESDLKALEDIVEVEEDSVSDQVSYYSMLNRFSDVRNSPGGSSFQNLSTHSLPKGVMSSCTYDYSLAILSRESMDMASDSLTGTTPDLDEVESVSSDRNDEEIQNDEELERAMAASLTSVRSHEILQQLKAEKVQLMTSAAATISSIGHVGKYGDSVAQIDESLNRLELLCPDTGISLPYSSVKQVAVEVSIAKTNGLEDVTLTKTLLRSPEAREKHGLEKPKQKPSKEHKTRKGDSASASKRKHQPAFQGGIFKRKSEKVEVATSAMILPSKGSSPKSEKAVDKRLKFSAATLPNSARGGCSKLWTMDRSSAVSHSGQRSSSGYDSGNDSGILAGESPSFQSPYSKLTKPKSSVCTSSGRGSDNSSAISAEPLAVPPSSLHRTMGGKLNFVVNPFRTNRRDFLPEAAREAATSTVTVPGSKNSSTVNSPSPLSSDQAESLPSSPKCQAGCKFGSKTWFHNVLNFRSRSAPQSPSNFPGRTFLSVVSSPRSPSRPLPSTSTCNSHDYAILKAKINGLLQKQEELKKELKRAKKRLCVPSNKWSYDLHIAEYLDTYSWNVLEALTQETKILEKRVNACKSHVMLVTYDMETTGDRLMNEHAHIILRTRKQWLIAVKFIN